MCVTISTNNNNNKNVKFLSRAYCAQSYIMRTNNGIAITEKFIPKTTARIRYNDNCKMRSTKCKRYIRKSAIRFCFFFVARWFVRCVCRCESLHANRMQKIPHKKKDAKKKLKKLFLFLCVLVYYFYCKNISVVFFFFIYFFFFFVLFLFQN